MDPRTINLNVLRRHDPRISNILDSTSYAVIYRYFHGAWSKTGFEGTLFVFQRHSHPLNGICVLNRQGLDNFCEALLAGWDVDLDEGLIIWRSAGATGDADDDVIYGIWVYEEKDRTRIATAMQEHINAASAQQLSQPTPSPPPVSLSHPVPRVPIISAGQTISLDQLFGVGSVCSEPPPLTSALPHPGTSAIDPEEIKENFIPTQILSPDASDLPKGMQLLDSLFQKAAIKSRNSDQPVAPHVESINHHSPSIQQLFDQTQVTLTNNRSSQMSPPKSSPHKGRRHAHQSSPTEETYKTQSTVITQATHTNNRTINTSHSSRPDYRALNHNNTNINSRRSSASSSSHSRNDQLSINNITTPRTHQRNLLLAQLNSLSTAGSAAAPAPIENVNAEARHNILSLLGHPAANGSRDAHSSPSSNYQNHPSSNHQNQMLASLSSGGGISQQETTNHHHGNNVRQMYHPDQRLHPSVGPPINTSSTTTRSHPGSQITSPQPSPNKSTQQAFPPRPLATPSHANTAHPSPPRAAHIQSATHSPNGPRPQARSGHRHHPPDNPPSGSPSSAHNFTSNAGPAAGPTSSTSVWPFNKLTPNRALSPLNPARQSPSSFNHQVGGTATVADKYAQSHHHHRQNLSPHPHPQQRHLLDHSPPEINDLSRPIKPDSHLSRPIKPDSNAINNHIELGSPKQSTKQVAINPKVAVDSLDELLISDGTCTNIEKSIQFSDPHQSNHLDSAPLDKSQFVNGILNMINNNGPFVDTLYARYLARYSEKYL